MNKPSIIDASFGEPGWLFAQFTDTGDTTAIVNGNNHVSYQQLLASIITMRELLIREGLKTGDCVAIQADFSTQSICVLLAAASLHCILVPVASAQGPVTQDSTRCILQRCLTIAKVNILVTISNAGDVNITSLPHSGTHPLLEQLRRADCAGLILFSSGSTGDPKAAVHRLDPLIKQHRRRARAYRTLGFLLFDHIGGLNTLFYSLANAGTFVLPASRSVKDVLQAMAQHQVELLPTTPSFLTLLLASGLHSQFNLDCWKLATYGTEPMSGSTLARLNDTFPNVYFKQTYGSTELGILPTRSRSSQSVLLTIDPQQTDTKVVNQRLSIRSPRRMLGYLNAADPFDENGWMDTGDLVETCESGMHIQGRDNDTINVGGQKVHPHTVEAVIATHSNVVDVTVFGQPHALLGQTVIAHIQFDTPLADVAATRLIRHHCSGQLQPYMVPSKVIHVTETAISDRFKKVRT